MSALRTVFLSASTFALVACATTDDRSSAQLIPQRSGTVIDANDEYVARVEWAARRRGIEVRWVNVPTKRTVYND